MSHEYTSTVEEVQELTAPSPLRSELIAAFNALITRIEKLEEELERMQDSESEDS